jgi:hypothetical protein
MGGRIDSHLRGFLFQINFSFYLASNFYIDDSYFFLFIYFLLFFRLPGVPFFKKSGLGNYWLIILFITRSRLVVLMDGFTVCRLTCKPVIPGIILNIQKQKRIGCLKDPVAFVKDLFTYNHDSTGNLFIAKTSYWNQLKAM